MGKRHSPNVAPGQVLRSEFLEPLGLSARALARDINVPANRITGILNGSRAITAQTAVLLARRFETSAEFWMNLQSAHDLQQVQRGTAAPIVNAPAIPGTPASPGPRAALKRARDQHAGIPWALEILQRLSDPENAGVQFTWAKLSRSYRFAPEDWDGLIEHILVSAAYAQRPSLAKWQIAESLNTVKELNRQADAAEYLVSCLSVAGKLSIAKGPSAIIAASRRTARIAAELEWLAKQFHALAARHQQSLQLIPSSQRLATDGMVAAFLGRLGTIFRHIFGRPHDDLTAFIATAVFDRPEPIDPDAGRSARRQWAERNPAARISAQKPKIRAAK